MKSPLLLSLVAFLSACSINVDELRMTIKGYKAPCEDVLGNASSCLVVSEDGGRTSYFHENELDFSFEWGKRIGLLVEQSRIMDPPQDASSVNYKVIAVVSEITEPDTSFITYVSTEFITFHSDSLMSVSWYEKKLHGSEIKAIKAMLMVDHPHRIRLTISTQNLMRDSLRVLRAERLD